MRKIRLSCVAAALLLTQTSRADDAIPAYIIAAVANPNRPETDRARDANRKPAEVIAFAGIKPGDKVADFMPGKGYFTHIFCKAVGDNGHVYAISIPVNRPATTPASANQSDKPAITQASNDACTNITAITLHTTNYPAPELHSSSDDPGWVYEYWTSRLPAESFTAPEPLDVIWTSENYHDLHNKSFGSPDLSLVDQALLKALKPGGILMIEDHTAAAGSGARDTETLHRIDVELVKQEVIAAGFEFVGASAVLHHADDPHTAKAHEMHDQTDRFLLKFRKP